MASPDERIAVLESRIADLGATDLRIEAMVMDGHNRLETKLDQFLKDSVSNEVARAMSRIWAFAAACFTGLVSTVIFIAINF